MQRIQAEKEILSAGDDRPPTDTHIGLGGVLSAMAAWQGNPSNVAASELRSRLRWQIQTYLGSPAVFVVERPGIRAEELLGKAGEILEVFLGPDAADAVRDDVLRGLDWTGTAAETYR
jgi:hypothetical protein